MAIEEKYNICNLVNILEGDEFGETYVKFLNSVFTDKTNEEKIKPSGPVTKFLENFYLTKDGSKAVYFNENMDHSNIKPSAPYMADEEDKNDKDKNDKDKPIDKKISWIKENLWIIYIVALFLIILLIVILIIILSCNKKKV